MMKTTIPASNDVTRIFKGVSTLDIKKIRVVLLFLVVIAFGSSIYAGHSILDRVDPNFDPQVQSAAYGAKYVWMLETLPNGKILAFGVFNSYNRVPTGKLVRLNADGSLDTSFNNQTISSIGNCNVKTRIIVQPDGKIILPCSNMVADGQAPKNLLRINEDGTLDTTFNYTLGSEINSIALDSQGRLAVQGGFQTPQGFRYLVRLNPDGSLDNSFNFTLNFLTLNTTTQGSRIIVGDSRVYRLNENGSEDTSFAASNINTSITQVITQPNNKILCLKDTGIVRVNENGGIDSSFQTTNFSLNGGSMKLAADGKIVTSNWSSSSTFRRYLANGGQDTSFSPYTSHASAQGAFTIQLDGSLILGDYYTPATTQGVNNFIRLTPGGLPDPTFNAGGGVGFQNILPASVRSIEALANGKVFLGGTFDVINNISRPRIARLNANSSVDLSFQINLGGTGNHFSVIFDIYQIRSQSDGKIVVSGWFDYVLGGVTKRNLVRLNSDGSIDPTFNLGQSIPDYSEINGAGRNHFSILGDGKLIVGTSRNGSQEIAGPIRLTTTGTLDASFIPMLNNHSAPLYIDDVAVQPDGKILVSGSHRNSSSNYFSFVARLNSDGSIDPTFPYTEEAGRLKSTLALLPGGKILVGKHSSGTGPGKVVRLNADGSADTSFNPVSITDGIINALATLPNGKIFVGGKFTATVNNQPSINLLQLNADGTLGASSYNLNSEVLGLAVDGDGRLLIGGDFTVIATNGSGTSRSFVARLTGPASNFDFDGDGRSDLGVFRPSDGNWYLKRSATGEFIQIFGVEVDKVAAADYDGDGITDLAVYRNGDWWYLNSSTGNVSLKSWGTATDIPFPSDFDGDGKADFIHFRPSTAEWFRCSSATGATSTVQFGAAGDIPLIADMDGDGKTDPTVFRPSTGTWWYRSGLVGADTAIQWGQSGDIPVPGDYDGDGQTDVAIFRPSNGLWYILNSGGGYTSMLWGTSEDRPVAADYDGDGRADIAIYRPSTGVWFIMQSTAGFTGMQYGIATDIAIQNAFIH